MTGYLLQIFCPWPERLHPVSGYFLDLFLHGRLTDHEFQRFFTLPNSGYLPLSRCVIDLVHLLGN